MTFKFNGATSMSKKNQTTSAVPTPAQTPRTSLSESRPSNKHASNTQQQQTLHELMNKAINGRAGFCTIWLPVGLPAYGRHTPHAILKTTLPTTAIFKVMDSNARKYQALNKA
ncbi:hypothetical protein BG003_005290 [Podila horticola]|nr:hypothetical protein BG003_005290 [Podila horticola]